MSAFERVMTALRDAGEPVKVYDGKARTRGSCHGGDNPTTVSVAIGKDKNVVIWCHKCQDTPGALDDFLANIGLTKADLYDEPKVKGSPQGKPIKSWTYTRLDNSVVQYVDKFIPKAFLPRLPDGQIKHPPKEERVLLYLPKVHAEAQAGGVITLCEGETDTDNANKAGAVATTMPGGAGMGWQDRYTEMFRGASEVRIIADRDPDDQGMKHARKVAASLTKAGIPWRIYLPACGKDLSDHVAAGAGLDDLIEVRDDSEQPTDADDTDDDQEEAEPEDRFPSIDWTEAFATDFSQIDWLVGRFMERGQQVAIVGPGKAGKSLFAAHWLWCAITGRSFLGDKCREPIRVLYFDRENSLRDIVTRMISLGANPAELSNGFDYRMFPRFSGALDASVVAAHELLHIVTVTQPDVVVLDTVSRFIGGKENDADTWLQFYGRIHAPLKALGVACVRLDHMGKDEERGSRGSSAKTQDVDHVWELVKLGDRKTYDPSSRVETITTDLKMNRTHTRSGLGEDTFLITRVGRRQKGGMWVAGGTGHALVTEGPDGLADGAPKEGTAAWLVQQLDEAGADRQWGNPTVIKWCAERGIKIAKAKIEEAVKIRKGRASDLPPHLPYSEVAFPSPASGEPRDVFAGQTFPGNHAGTIREPHDGPSFPRPLPKEGEGGTGRTHCADCGGVLDPFLVGQGITVHIGCERPVAAAS